MPNNELYKGITIRRSTVTRLDSIKHTGQSYDGIINEILDEIQILLEAHKNNDKATKSGSAEPSE